MARRAIHRITLVEVEYVAHRLARELMEWGEPIPEFGTRFPNVLESCLETPFQTFQRKSLYRGVVGKSAILFYLMVKNHPFQNGNKRVAIATLLYFLHRNGRWLRVSNDELYDIAKWVAGSDPKSKEKVLASVKGFLQKAIVID